MTATIALLRAVDIGRDGKASTAELRPPVEWAVVVVVDPSEGPAPAMRHVAFSARPPAPDAPAAIDPARS